MDAVRRLLLEAEAKGLSLKEVAEGLTPEDIARHLYTAGLPDPDFIIRTSGEIRLSRDRGGPFGLEDGAGA